MMRILFIAGFAESLLRFRGALIAELIEFGLEVHAAAPGLEEGSRERDKLEAVGVIVHNIALERTGLNPLSDLKALGELISLAFRLRPQYLFAYTIKPVIYGMVAGWVARIPRRFALITGLGYSFDSAGNRRFVSLVARGMYRLALRRAHHVFFQNPDDQRLFRSTILSERVSCSVVNGSGVDTTYFAKAAVRTHRGSCFLMIARLLGDKGVREYAAAAREIRKTNPGVQFMLAGWIDENPDSISETELKSWVDAGAIEYLGKLDDVRGPLKECTVYVLPSYREGTPRTVLEAMAVGRAIITTDAPGCRETVEHGHNGFLVPPREVVPLVEAMRLFIDDSNLAAIMGFRSRLLAEQKYDVRNVNRDLLRAMSIEKIQP